MRSKKDRASQKQRSDFLAAPVHKAPPGRQKSEREFCLFGGVFLRPACRAVCRGGRFCAACRCCAGFRARCSGVFLPVLRCLVPGLRAACCFCAWSGLCCRGLLAVCPPCACVCGAFAAAIWPVWLAAPGCREVPPLGGCACALPQVSPRPAAVFPAFVFCRFCADFCTCCLFVRRALCVCAHFSLIFRLFLPNFFLSKFFSFVAHAATGLLFFSSLCGVVFRPACSLPSLRRLPPLWRLLCQVSVCLPCGFVCALFVCLLPFST